MVNAQVPAPARADGTRSVRGCTVQRYLCRSCDHRFSDPKVKVDIIKQSLEFSDSMHDLGHLDFINVGFGEVGFQDPSLTARKDICSHRFSVTGKTINKFLLNSRERQICAPKSESKNLAKMEPPKNRLAGATKLSKEELKGKVVEYTF